VSETKQTKTGRRNGAGGRRFSPSRENLTEGGRIYGTLVANQRARLGLSQEELAARVRTSPSSIARVEQGQMPSAEMLKRLSAELNPKPVGRIRRLFSSAATRFPKRRPRVSGGERLLWGGLVVALIALAGLIGGQFSSGESGAHAAQPALQVSHSIGAPAAIHKARVQAQRAAAAQARRAAEKARERQRAAAAAAAAVAARKAAAKAARQSTPPPSTPSQSAPVTAPVAPSPSPAPSGGGGSSSAPKPGLSHGIGAGG